MPSVYKPPQGKHTTGPGMLLGLVVAGFLFLAIPLTQILTETRRPPESIEPLAIAAPPPPPPLTEPPPPPPEPEPEEPPPELEAPPPPITLAQLDLVLNPGTGGSMGGDFALPTFDVSQTDLNDLDVFEIDEIDSPPQAQGKVEFAYPAAARRRGIQGIVHVEYVVNEDGRTEAIKITQSPHEILSQATIHVIRGLQFEPATKGGRPVKVRMRAAIPFQ